MPLSTRRPIPAIALPDRHRGRIRALAGQCRPEDELLLGVRQRFRQRRPSASPSSSPSSSPSTGPTHRWNGSYTQSGNNVTVTNAAYNGSVAAGGNTTFGFTATDTGSDAAPAQLSCTAR